MIAAAALLLCAAATDRAAAPLLGAGCTAAGDWVCGTAYHARATRLAAGQYLFVRIPPPPAGKSWTNATVTAHNGQLSALFDTGHTDTGVLSADCKTIHWADQSVWLHNSSAVPPANPLCTSVPGRPTFHMAGELKPGTQHTTHSNDINSIFWCLLRLLWL